MPGANSCLSRDESNRRQTIARGRARATSGVHGSCLASEVFLGGPGAFLETVAETDQQPARSVAQADSVRPAGRSGETVMKTASWR